jgi:16S rRNA (guanine527-N7)-methyltransferase
MVEDRNQIARQINEMLAGSGQSPLDLATAGGLAGYVQLLMRWNAKVNLTAIRDLNGILERHILESVFCARQIERGIKTLMDFGSGAGLPGLPIAICRPEIAVTLAESQGKKASFLREVARVLALPVEIYADRAENVGRTFDCITLRAVDKMADALMTARALLNPGGSLVVMTTAGGADEVGLSLEDLELRREVALPGSRSQSIWFFS